MDYVTIASRGKCTRFWRLNSCWICILVSPPLEVVFVGRLNPSTYYNVIQYVTISTTGNAQDFGDLSYVVGFAGYLSSTRGLIGGGYSASNIYKHY